MMLAVVMVVLCYILGSQVIVMMIIVAVMMEVWCYIFRLCRGDCDDADYYGGGFVLHI